MTTILCLETSTKACSVALGQNGKIISLKESVDEQYSHAENLTLYIQEACAQAKIDLNGLDAIAVSKGPGSFTGLRIGVSVAKGLCYALNKPLISINSLKAMAAGCVHLPSSISHFPLWFCPMIDARRMEVYCAVYDEQLNEIKKTSADIIDENSFSDLLQTHQIVFLGDGAEKCRAKITHANAIFLDGISPSAQFMIPLAEKIFAEKRFEDVAYFEPYYLKDFFDTKSIKS